MPKDRIIISVAKKELKRRERRAAGWGFVSGCAWTLFVVIVAVQMTGGA
jgi:hypothetical protein